MEIAMKAADWNLVWVHVPIHAIYHGGGSHFKGALDTWRIAKFSLRC
jgi:predicted SnoaL-like aldol condensation-catalyzing enzyme